MDNNPGPGQCDNLYLIGCGCPGAELEAQPPNDGTGLECLREEGLLNLVVVVDDDDLVMIRCCWWFCGGPVVEFGSIYLAVRG